MFKYFVESFPTTLFITMIHYRNLGGDIGRVLVGVDVPPGHEAALDGFLETFQFPCQEVTENPVFKEFSPFI